MTLKEMNSTFSWYDNLKMHARGMCVVACAYLISKHPNGVKSVKFSEGLTPPSATTTVISAGFTAVVTGIGVALVLTINLHDEISENGFLYKYAPSLLFCLSAYFQLILTHICIRRLDWKYRDKLLLHPEVYLLVMFAWFFSAQTLIKNRWQRCFVYFVPYKDYMFRGQLRQEILPEFDYKKDVWLIDKILFYGQFIFFFAGIILYAISKH